MPLYVADYIADTTDLTMREHGAYMLLILHYWRRGCLPLEGQITDEAIASGLLERCYRVCSTGGVGDETAVKRVISRFFTWDGTKWSHKRIDIELNKANEISSIRAKIGAKGGVESGKTRQAIAEANTQAKSKQTPKQNRSDHNHSHNQSKEEEKEPPLSPKGETTNTATRLPDNWLPPPEARHLATELGVNYENELAKFRDYWAAVPDSRGRKKDWPATLRNWLRTAAERLPPNTRTGPAALNLDTDAFGYSTK